VRRALAAALALGVLAVALAACGLGSGGGETPTGVSVLVTRDFGAKHLGSKSASSVPAGETVMRYLEREFTVTTRYGGGFVESIEGLSGSTAEGHRLDWFYYVNGIEAPQGAAARKIHPGDVIWWDRHDWSATQHIPAVVGAYPEPFLSGDEGHKLPVAIVCAGQQRTCTEVRRRLQNQGVTRISGAGIGAGVGSELLRVVVGPWSRIRQDPAAAQLAKGPRASGVYARTSPGGIQLLDQNGNVVNTLTTAGGLVAATRFGQQQPTWVVTGTDDAGVAAAAAAFRTAALDGHFAVAVEQGRSVPLPTSSVPPS
jgi:hypothetical protein